MNKDTQIKWYVQNNHNTSNIKRWKDRQTLHPHELSSYKTRKKKDPSREWINDKDWVALLLSGQGFFLYYSHIKLYILTDIVLSWTIAGYYWKTGWRHCV